MKTTSIAPNYRGYRLPTEMISHLAWLYFRFSLPFRDIEELLAERGSVVTSETICQQRPDNSESMGGARDIL